MRNAARILVATDRRDHARLILQHLQGEFEQLRSSTDPGLAAQDFEDFDPEVLVLAFDRLDKAQAYCFALHGTVVPPPRNDYRTVILCDSDECATVAELCRKEHFDDYVLYWPQAYDGFRLAMSVRIACREMAAARVYRTRPQKLLEQAHHVAELNRILDCELDDVDQQVLRIKDSLELTEREITATVDGFSRRLCDPSSVDRIAVDDRASLAHEFDGLKDGQIEAARRSVAIEIESVRTRTKDLKDRLEPSLAGSRTLVDELRKLRPVVMIVEDDEFARELVSRTLDPLHWEAVFAADGAAAISQLDTMRPDVILMDIRLPGVDGVSLTRRLKSSPHLADIPVVMMTGDARRETLLSSLAAGAAGFVVKPFTRAVVTAKLEKVLGR